MKLIEFSKRYGSEEKCMTAFRTYKETKGIVCKSCGSTDHYWNKRHVSHDCKNCGYRTTLRSGTVMEASKLPFHYWLQAIFMMTMTKKGISALEMQRQIGHKRYEPIWAMMHKIRAMMGLRDSNYDLSDVIELDDAFFKTHSDEDIANEKQKRGRGSQKQSKVLVMAKVDPKVGRPKKNKKSSAFRYVKMFVIPDSSSKTMFDAVVYNTGANVTIKSDAWRGFNSLKEIVCKHIKRAVLPTDAPKILPWVHTLISNAKRNFLGINHNIKNEYLQNYLNEFCYKTNRRYFKERLFERLMIATIEDTWYGKFRYGNG